MFGFICVDSKIQKENIVEGGGFPAGINHTHTQVGFVVVVGGASNKQEVANC